MWNSENEGINQLCEKLPIINTLTKVKWVKGLNIEYRIVDINCLE